jgi:signal transduction histidine kinase
VGIREERPALSSGRSPACRHSSGLPSSGCTDFPYCDGSTWPVTPDGTIGQVTVPAPRSRAGTAFWNRLPRVLERTVLVIVALALSVQVVIVVEAGNPVGGWLAIVLSSAGIGVRHRDPHLGLGLTAAAPVGAALLGWDPIASWSLACFVAFLLTLRSLPGLLTGAVVGAANLTASWISLGTALPSQNPGASIAACAAFVTASAGSAIRGHRQYWSELERRTAQAIATREAAVNRSVAEERVRIARDLHDSVGHQIAVVNMRLGAAEVHLPADAEASRADLGAARAAVQEVLRETQQILQVLRVGTEEQTVAPTPGHALLPDLIASFREAGLEVEATLPEQPLDLPPAVGAAVYRIAQESLTNAQKYGTGSASILLERTPGERIVVEVVNPRTDAARRGSSPGGNGIIGMRERAAAAHGSLQVRADGHLFWVRAELPARATD